MKLLVIAFAYIVCANADVSQLSSNEYLPPNQDVSPVQSPVSNFIQELTAPAAVYDPAPTESAPAHILADDGYHYKTQRRVVYRRNRRDVSHLSSSEYLPPVQSASVAAPGNEYLPPVQQAIPAPVNVPAPTQVQVQASVPAEAAPAHILADDGYRYKTHRRVVYRRHRRDASHLPSNDYLPPVQGAPLVVPTNDYLPPVQQAVEIPAPVYGPAPASVAVPVEAAPAHVLADDGYRYKTHRRVVYRRHRRDVSHLPSNDYLPPVQGAPVVVPTNEYLPPIQQASPAHGFVYDSTPISVSAPIETAPAHVLADDGYRYKTHRRVIYRRN